MLDTTLQLINQLDHTDESTRRYAIGDLGDTAAGPLATLMSDPSAAIRETVVEALTTIGGRAVVDAVIPLLHSEQAPVRNAACQVLTAIGQEAVGPLCDELHSVNKDVRKFAVDTLITIADPACLDPMIKLLDVSDVNVAAAAAEAIGLIGREEHVANLKSHLQGESWMQCAVAEAFGRLGGDQANALLATLSDDGDPMVRMIARRWV